MTSIHSVWATCDAQIESVGRNPPPSGRLTRTAQGLWSSPGRNPAADLARFLTSDLQLISGQAVSTDRTHGCSNQLTAGAAQFESMSAHLNVEAR